MSPPFPFGFDWLQVIPGSDASDVFSESESRYRACDYPGSQSFWFGFVLLSKRARSSCPMECGDGISTGESLSTDPQGESQSTSDTGLKPRLELPSLPANRR